MQNNRRGLQSIQPQEVHCGPVTEHKKKKPKEKLAEQGLSEYSTRYDVVSELVSASSSTHFSHLIRGGVNKGETNIRRILSRGARVRRNVAAAETAPGKRPCRLKVVSTKAYGSEAEALLHFGAVLNPISENLYNKLDLGAE